MRGLTDGATLKSSESSFPPACTLEPHRRLKVLVLDIWQTHSQTLWSELGHSHTVCSLWCTTALLEYDYFLPQHFLWRPSCTHTTFISRWHFIWLYCWSQINTVFQIHLTAVEPSLVVLDVSSVSPHWILWTFVVTAAAIKQKVYLHTLKGSILCIILYVADPATFLASDRVLGTLFSSENILFICFKKDKYIWVCKY